MHEFRVPLFERNRQRVRAWALVDEADLYELLGFRWTLTTRGYASRAVWSGRVNIPMHRHLLGLEPGDSRQVDHVNRDRLDNRRVNLRVVSAKENAQNIPAVGRSKHRGVWWHRKAGKWVANVWVDGKCQYLGLFVFEEEAAEAAREYRLERVAGAVD